MKYYRLTYACISTIFYVSIETIMICMVDWLLLKVSLKDCPVRWTENRQNCQAQWAMISGVEASN